MRYNTIIHITNKMHQIFNVQHCTRCTRYSRKCIRFGFQLLYISSIRIMWLTITPLNKFRLMRAAYFEGPIVGDQKPKKMAYYDFPPDVVGNILSILNFLLFSKFVHISFSPIFSNFTHAFTASKMLSGQFYLRMSPNLAQPRQAENRSMRFC